MTRALVLPVLVAIAAVGNAACAEPWVVIPVEAPRVREAADELCAGAKRVTVQSTDGSSHEVNAEWRLVYLDRALSPEGTWTLGQVGSACAPGSLVQCPTDPSFISSLNRNNELVGGPWLETAKPAATPAGASVAGGLLALGIVGGFVTAEVTCFTSWCSDGGKVAFVATDAAVLIGALGIAAFWAAVAHGMNN